MTNGSSQQGSGDSGSPSGIAAKVPILAFVAGLVVIGIAFIVFFLKINMPVFYFSLCIGFAMILGGLGTTATIKYKGATVTGAGAVAVVLYFVLIKFGFPTLTHGTIYGSFTDATEIVVVADDNELMGGFMTTKERYYRFIVLDQPVSPNLAVWIDGKKLKVSRSKITEHLGGRFEWYYESSDRTLRDYNDTSRVIAGASDGGRRSGWVTPVYAEEVAAPPDTAVLREILAGMHSPNLRVRMAAIRQIAFFGTPAFDFFMAELRKAPQDSLLRAGILYAMDEFLDRDLQNKGQLTKYFDLNENKDLLRSNERLNQRYLEDIQTQIKK